MPDVGGEKNELVPVVIGPVVEGIQHRDAVLIDAAQRRVQGGYNAYPQTMFPFASIECFTLT